MIKRIQASKIFKKDAKDMISQFFEELLDIKNRLQISYHIKIYGWTKMVKILLDSKISNFFSCAQDMNEARKIINEKN